MKTYDLTQLISVDMPVYPGTERPVIAAACTLEKDFFVEKKLTFYSHTGTHMDAPCHIFPYGKTLDAFPPERFYGKATVLDVSQYHKPYIEVEDMLPFAPQLQGVEFVLLHTGWFRNWGSDRYFHGFPVLTKEAAQWLTCFHLKGLGVDAISVDEVGSTEFPVHKAFLIREICIIENLNNLSPLIGKTFDFFCLPLLIKESDGAPVRALGILPEICEQVGKF